MKILQNADKIEIDESRKNGVDVNIGERAVSDSRDVAAPRLTLVVGPGSQR